MPPEAAVVDPLVNYFLLTDQVGTLRAVADTSGAIVKRIDYDSFGNIIADSNPAFSVPFGFAGGLHDRDTGLVRFGYRDYSPELGRFTAKDPIDFAGGDTNLYAYVMSDPVNWIDPDGLSVLDWLVVPGPYGQPRSEWGPNGPTGWGNPLQYTENAGGAWKWAERVAVGSAGAAAGAAGALWAAEAGGACYAGSYSMHAIRQSIVRGIGIGSVATAMNQGQRFLDPTHGSIVSVFDGIAAARIGKVITTIMKMSRIPNKYIPWWQ